MKIVKLILILLLFLCKVKAQHNSDYVQYMFNGLLLNPAYAGSHDALNITSLYRNQWLGLPGAPVSAIISAHSPLKNKKVNIGGVLTDDRFGVFDHTKASLVYAYRLKFLKGHLSFGLQGGVDSYSTNWNKISTADASDPNFSGTATRKFLPEVSAGTFYHTPGFYVGLSALNIYNGELNTGMVGTISSGCVIKLSENTRLKPAVLVKYIHNSPFSANISSTFYYKDIVGFGLGYSYNTSAMALIDLKINEQLHFGYGYDYSLNALQAYTSGSHEIMLRYLFRYKINAFNARYF